MRRKIRGKGELEKTREKRKETENTEIGLLLL